MLIINGQAPANATILTDDELQNTKALGAWILVWVYRSFYNWYKWQYGRHWVVYPPGTVKQSSSAWMFEYRLKECYMIYGWFRVSGWVLRWIYAYTIPWNYYRYWTPLCHVMIKIAHMNINIVIKLFKRVINSIKSG